MELLYPENSPPGTSTYRLDDGRIFRVHLELLTPPEQLAEGDRLSVSSRGYQVDEAGALVPGKDGTPVTIKEERAVIPMENIRNGSLSVKPGWLRLPDAEQVEAGTNEPLDVRDLLGQDGEVRRMEDGLLYRWTIGEYERIRRRRAGEAPPPSAPPLDTATVAEFIP